ncbi:hypothetical protein [Marinobacter persicus]|jgi:hypothetical protein|uniref:Uncharacterized protein n=1 Tax=Marinobacter persicus TaxID=930118 RepID=A0A2S6GA58_9GAMM|nr:hypothetical protein [Marinobacter persicus]KXS53223.1 MAG: hypothetical protein AWU57_2397 [Marinobacter sp. T13-3]PPK53340.1 hypothetical protein BY455_102141 [Marinobacter persicus]PPK56177.1 hypothetical protein B0H24_1002141 [Marinobacter persicus]PPK59772.1 hypothetical protein BY454_102141 [Marinobacter persicus]
MTGKGGKDSGWGDVKQARTDVQRGMMSRDLGIGDGNGGLAAITGGDGRPLREMPVHQFPGNICKCLACSSV